MQWMNDPDLVVTLKQAQMAAHACMRITCRIFSESSFSLGFLWPTAPAKSSATSASATQCLYRLPRLSAALPLCLCASRRSAVAARET
jgi:hypothetical protein